MCNILFKGLLKTCMISLPCKKQFIWWPRAGNLHKYLIARSPSLCGLISQSSIPFSWIKGPKQQHPLTTRYLENHSTNVRLRICVCEWKAESLDSLLEGSEEKQRRHWKLRFRLWPQNHLKVPCPMPWVDLPHKPQHMPVESACVEQHSCDPKWIWSNPRLSPILQSKW